MFDARDVLVVSLAGPLASLVMGLGLVWAMVVVDAAYGTVGFGLFALITLVGGAVRPLANGDMEAEHLSDGAMARFGWWGIRCPEEWAALVREAEERPSGGG